MDEPGVYTGMIVREANDIRGAEFEECRIMVTAPARDRRPDSPKTTDRLKKIQNQQTPYDNLNTGGKNRTP